MGDFRTVFVVTNPRNSAYLWYSRRSEENYIMEHRKSISKGKLHLHSCYIQMSFKEVKDPETIAWVNYMLDNNTYVPLYSFKNFAYYSMYVKDANGIIKNNKDNKDEPFVDIEDTSEQSLNLSTGDVVIVKSKTCDNYWIFKLGKPRQKTGWFLTSGFPKDDSLVGTKLKTTLPTSTYADNSDIIRLVNKSEKLWFENCCMDNRMYSKRHFEITEPTTVTEPPNTHSLELNSTECLTLTRDDSGTGNTGMKWVDTDEPSIKKVNGNIIHFGINNKVSKENKSNIVKFKLSKIKKYEY